MLFGNRFAKMEGTNDGSGQGAGAAGGGDGAAGGGASGAAGPWYSGFEPDIKGFVEMKGWGSAADAVTSYRNLEKLTGAPPEQLLRIPKADDAEAWGKTYERLGRPATPDEYKLPINSGDDGAFAKDVSAWFHEAGLNTKQAHAVAEKWNGYVAAKQAEQAEAQKAKFEADEKALTKEWGAAYQKNVQVAKAVASKFGFDAATIDALEGATGFAGVMKFLHGIGAKIGEDSFVSGGSTGGSGAMTPAAAKARIAALREDKGFQEKYFGGDAAAKQEMERLHQMAYQDG